MSPSEDNDFKAGLPRLVFDQLAVGYGGHPVLVDVCGVLEAGQALALVGPNGSGKTTLLKALTGAVEILGGEVHKPQGAIGYVPQNADLDLSFPVTVEHVVMMGLYKEIGWGRFPRARHRARVEATLERVGLAELARRRFGDLSGGQRQRLAIARALLKKTEVILFDEATSALDNETQEQIQRAIGNLQGEYTILIVAHRLSTVIDSDRIFVVDKGKIVADGTHQELLRSCQFYHDLYRKDLV